MNYINILVDLFPIIICGVLIGVFKKPVWMSGAFGVIAALLTAQYKCHYEFNYSNSFEIINTSFILSLSAVLVIIPGLYLNNVLKVSHIIDEIIVWVDNIKIKKEVKVLLLILGILPALESLTGFGVSLFLGVPLFFRMFESKKAYKLSVLGMNAMPWGTLGLALVIGSKLSGYSLVDIAAQTAIFSSVIFPVVGCIALYIVGGFSLIKRYAYLAIIFGLLLGVMLYVFAKLNMVEISGVLAGISGTIIMFFFLRLLFKTKHNEIGKEHRFLEVMHFTFPYLLVLVLICIFKFVTPVSDFLNNAIVLRSEHMSFAPLGSPGLALTIVVLFMLFKNSSMKLEHRIILKRGWLSGFGLFLFILISQIMSQTGIITDIITIISNVKDKHIIMLIMHAIGMIGGFITGSTVGSNALLMHIQQQIGNNIGSGLLFSAMQNSAGGHSAMFSLSIIIMITMIAKDYITPQDKIDNEAFLLKFNLKCLMLLYVILVVDLFVHYFIG